FFDEPLGDAKDAAPLPHVFAEHKHPMVPAHLLGQGFPDGFQQRLGGHRRLHLPYSAYTCRVRSSGSGSGASSAYATAAPTTARSRGGTTASAPTVRRTKPKR